MVWSGLWLVTQNPGDSLDVGLAWGGQCWGTHPRPVGLCLRADVLGWRWIAGAQAASEGCLVEWGEPHRLDVGAEPFQRAS